MYLGDLVMVARVRLPRGGSFYVIGEPRFSDAGEVLIIANDDTVGLSIARHWLKIESGGHTDIALRLRQRYLEKYPLMLKAEQ
jgi:hypothetical protein